MTYNVFGGTLNLTQSNPIQSSAVTQVFQVFLQLHVLVTLVFLFRVYFRFVHSRLCSLGACDCCFDPQTQEAPLPQRVQHVCRA